VNRQIRGYCVGLPKTGTTSLEGLFKTHCRVAHEPEAGDLVQTILLRAKGDLTGPQFLDWLKKRDERLALDLESSNFLVYLVPALVHEFPDAKFILTLRDCISWLDSFLNMCLNEPPNRPELLSRLRQARYNAGNPPHDDKERPLKERGLFTVRGYLTYWTWHNRKILDSVPSNRLLVLKTHEITERAEKIAEFLGLDPSKVRLEGAHQNKTLKKSNLLSELDPDFVNEAARECCGELMREYFPEYRLE
jgi:hypothetical protein